MLLRKPDFYDSFKCIASKCSDTCCVGWEIDVDEASQEAYRNVAGVFGDKLRSNIEDGHFKLLPHDRCPFLDRENLCEIYRNLGEDALCDICREHPRFVEVYGDIMERGLGLCCEEAARLLLAGEGPLSFVNEECDEPEDDLDDDDREIRDEVLGERERMLGTLASSSVHFTDKLESVFAYNGKDPFFPFKSAHDMYELLAKTESFGPAWDAALAQIKAHIDIAGDTTHPEPPECQFSETESLRLIAYLKAHDIPVYSSQMVTSKFTALAINYLNRRLAPHITRHGVLVDVYGVGVFLSGKSGVGKSEAALELIKRGHQLVADDVVDICRISDNRLIGTCPEKIRHLMEIRGIGVIDIKALYGIGAVAQSKTIDLIIELETWDENKAYDRIGLQDDTIEIMGVRVPHQLMPIKPGRNLAIIVEVAARNHSLKRTGYNAARGLSSLFQDDSNE